MTWPFSFLFYFSLSSCHFFFVEAVLGSRVRERLQRRSARASMPRSRAPLNSTPTRTVAPGLRALPPKSIPLAVLFLLDRCRSVPDFNLPATQCRRSRVSDSRPATLPRVHRPGPRRHPCGLHVYYARACDSERDANRGTYATFIMWAGAAVMRPKTISSLAILKTSTPLDNFPHPSETPKTHLFSHLHSRAVQDALNVSEWHL